MERNIHVVGGERGRLATPDALIQPKAKAQLFEVGCNVGVGRAVGASEPIVSHALSVSRQIVECIEPVEVVNGHLSDGTWLGQAQIDRDAAASTLVCTLSPPVGDAPAGRAEVKLDGLAAHVGPTWPRDHDSFAFVVVCLQHAIAPADCAVAGGGGFRHALELPANSTAMTGAMDHVGVRSKLQPNSIE